MIIPRNAESIAIEPPQKTHASRFTQGCGLLAEVECALAIARVEEAIAEFNAACNTAGVPHQMIREEGDPFTQFIAHARYHDLMLFGLRSIFDFGVLGDRNDNPAEELSKLLKAGVRPILAVSEEYRPIERVLIAYSGSMESANTMRRFVQTGLWADATVKIVYFHERVGEGASLVREAADYCRYYGVKAEAEVLPGSATDDLLAVAQDWGADLIAMGNSSRSLIARRVFGDTVAPTIRNAEWPLFLAQ